MPSAENALISIRPNYAEAILSGVKTVELRRRIPMINLGTCLWIYATLPLGAVIGTAVVAEIIHGTPEEIWEICMSRAAVDRDSYDEYFEGTNRALGLVLTNITRRQPIGIEKLRKMRKGFHPPQVLARLSIQETHSLSEHALEIS